MFAVTRRGSWSRLYGWLAVILLTLQVGCSEIGEHRAQRQFVQAFEEAQKMQDVDAMLALYAWEGVEEETYGVLRISVHTEIGWPIRWAKVVPLSASEGYHYRHQEVDYVPNLQPVARLHVAYDLPQATQSSYLLGKDETGSYRLVLPKKAAKEE